MKSRRGADTRRKGKPDAPRHVDAWRGGGLALVGLLVLQLLLGIGANIRLALPAVSGFAHAGADRALDWALADAPLLLRAHAAVGMLLAVGSLLLLALALRAPRRPARIATSLCGAAAILAAGLCGALYIATGRSLYAAVMTGGLVTGIASYAAGLYVTAPPEDR